ncbi:zinc finger protein 469 [Nothoprocta perdicaria]|uniref:zinc finger protein 469 n=1 Tax=Nothoprocta perdicaria TaxID=30464 RepID=UPI000E1C0413|nr:zinc finger protein 469 [Nothoprocta perdicaria]
MTGETQHVYAISDTEAGAKEQGKDFGFERCAEKDGRAFGSAVPDAPEPCPRGAADGTGPFPGAKDKEPHGQREAVIRPQQAGKIDFKSLQSKPKFAGDGAWSGLDGGPRSPPGKSRAREKSRRAAKGERGQQQQQLYRLSLAGARPNPTIGIAYPQQKVAPPKEPPAARTGALGGSYRFHVPGAPEREAELQHDELGLGRRFAEAAASLTSTNYTSEAAAGARLAAKGQPPAGLPLKSPGPHGQLHYLEFQANGTNSWPSPEKSFPGANYGAPKPSSLGEGGKGGALGSLPFSFPFQLLHEAAKEPFRGDAAGQEYGEAPPAPAAFGFAARDWQDEALSGAYESAPAEARLYGLPFLSPAPVGHHGAYKGRSERPADLNGALPSSGAIDPNPSTFQENQAVFPSSLHSPSVPKPVGKRQASSKDSVPSPRLLVQSSPLRRNMPPSPLSQVHFQNKVYCGSPAGSAGAGSVPFDTSLATPPATHARLGQAWDGTTKAFSPADPNSAPYPNPVGNQFSFERPPGPEQRQHRQKSARVPWQQMHLAPAAPAPNRIELARQLSGQKPPFSLGTSEWQGGVKAQPLSSSPGYHSKKLLAGEGLGAPRGDPGRQGCGSTGTFSFESGKEPASAACDARSKALFYSMGQAGPPPASRNSSSSALALPPSALVAASPCESPLPSPVPNPTCSSTCSSLSPMSSSPLNPSFEDSQMSGALTPSPFFHHPAHPKESNKAFHPAEVLSSGSLHYHPSDSVKSFHFPPDALKDDPLLKCAPESPFPKPGMEVPKGCLDGLDGEPPPPPYSSHHLLATSLSSASLDQLDVLLTCKQCDQNYSNLSSFLEHRQFCGSHAVLPGEPKDMPRAGECRKTLPPEPAKHSQAGGNLALSPEPPAHLMALNKSDDFLLEGESKSEGKDDALKGNLFNGLTAAPLPLTASDLEIDDAKLDSLITEALNGLEYQSDNPEIDSSFIDVFADEELTAVKAAGNGLSHKAKEASESKSKHPGPKEKAASQPRGSCHYEDSRPGGEQARRRAGKQHVHKGRAARRLGGREAERQEKPRVPEPPRSKSPDREAAGEERPDKAARLRLGRKNSGGCAPSPNQRQPRKVNQDTHAKSEVGPSVATKSSKPPRFSMKDMKKRKARSGTWSKELIHKIVQQKNKFHKLHVKSNKHVQFSLVTERLMPAAKEGKFQEYDYISDSDDDGTECTKLHGRKRRGAGFIGRSKYSFSKKRPGRSERAKEKDPAQSYSRKRESRRREIQEHRRVPSEEAAKKDDCATRARRRSSQSSPGSTHSISASSEPGPSPRCAQRADSDGEKGSVQARRRSDGSELTPRTLHEDRSPRESHKSQEEFSRGTKRFGSAKFLLAGSRTHPSAKADVPLTSYVKDEHLPQAQEKQLPSTGTFGRSPSRPSCKDHAEEPKGAASHAGETGKPILEAQESPELAVVNHRHPFAPYTGDALKYPAEELIAPSHVSGEASPGNVSAAYPEADVKYLKERGLCDGRKDYPAPVAPYGGDAVGMMLAGKVPDTYVNSDSTFFDHKDLPGHYEPNLFSKPPALGSSHTGDMYLCRDDISSGSFEQKHADISPYAAENPQAKVSSPLSFDSSSIFGELPVTEFDPPLYEGVSASKDTYVTTFACPGNAPSKSLPFGQPYAPFMQEKDWTLMEEVAPMLPEDVTQFHNLSTEKPLAKKFPDEGAGPPNQLSLPLSDRITDYNVTFMNNISDDELEIKRLVTELESQLQTGKMNNEAPAALQKPEQHVAAQLRERAPEQFPALPVDQEPGHEKGLFLAGDLGSPSLLATKTCAGERLGSEKPGVSNEHGTYERPREAWSCPVEFGSLEAGMCTPGSEDSLSVDPFCSKDARDQFQGAETAKESDSRKRERESSSQGLPASQTDKIEAPIYTEHMTKTPRVVTEPLFPKTLEAAEPNKEDILPSLPCKPGAENFPVAGKTAKNFDDSAELEKFDTHLPNLKPEFAFEQAPAPALDLAFSSCIKEVPDTEERPLSESESPRMGKSAGSFGGDSGGQVSLEETEDKSAATYPAPAAGDKASKQKVLLLDMLSLPKERDGGSQKRVASPEAAANPLQQLQLFVARTVKNNEEELLLPCFPGLLAPNQAPPGARVQPERSDDNAQGDNGTCCPAREEGDVPVGGEAEGIGTPSKEPAVFSGEPGPFGEMDSYRAKQSTFVNLELQNNVTEPQHMASERAEQGDINIRADGVSQEHSDLSPLRNAAVTPLPGQGKKADQLVGEREQDKNEATLAFKKHEASLLSHSSLEKEALGSAAAERLEKSEAGHGAQPLCGASGSPASPLDPSGDLHQDHRLLQDTKACPVNAKVPEEGNGKRTSLGGCHCASESLAGPPSPTNLPQSQHLQSDGAEGGEMPSFSARPAGDNKYSASLLGAEASSSAFITKSRPPDTDSSQMCHPSASPAEQAKWRGAPAFALALHPCGASVPAPLEAVGSSHHHLSSYGAPGREGQARPRAALRAGDLMGSALEIEAPQKPRVKDCSLACLPPFNPRDVGKEVPGSPCAVSGPHFKESQAQTVADTIANSQPCPPETQGYPALPMTDLLLIREGEVNLHQKELENCSPGESSPQNEAEALPSGSVAQQIPPALSSSPQRIAELSPAKLHSHHCSDAAEGRSGDPSRTMENGGKNVKGEKTPNHGAEHGGDAGTCVLSNMCQGKDSVFTGLPNASQNELLKEKKPSGLQVTCDICSASFRSKPGLTRHKAVKHQIKNSSISQASKPPESDLVLVDKASNVAKKVPRRTLKTCVKEKICSSQMPDAAVEYSPKKIGPGLEKEPSAQMQAVVSRVLSDLSVISLEMSQELLRTGILNRGMEAKDQSSETRGAGEEEAEHPGKQARKGEKGRRNQSKDAAGVNSNPDRKLNRKVGRKKAKAFPDRNEPGGSSELESHVNSGPSPADLSSVSSSLATAIEGLQEPGSCSSTEERNQPTSLQHSQRARQCPCAVEDPGSRMESSKEMVGKESAKGTVACPAEVGDSSGVENAEACKEWVAKQVEKGMGKVGKEWPLRGEGTGDMDTETKDSCAGKSRAGNQSSVPQSPTGSAEEKQGLETTQKAPAQSTMQDSRGASPPHGDTKRWVKGDVQQGQEHCVDSAAVAGLQSLLDDDSTFSQLFPRDEQFVRRKCTRVYGKRTKKPKPVTEANIRPAGAVDLFTIRLASDLSETSSFCVTREDPCEYETISIDDALMLNMCHSSKANSGEAAPSGAKNTALRSDCEKINQEKEVIDLEDNNVLNFLCQDSQVESVPSLNLWGCLEKEGESLSAEEMFEAPVDLENEHSLGETSSEPPDLAEEPFNDKASEEDSDSPEFHTIDIEMLNAKLKMRDVCFFGPCEDLPGRADEDAMSFKQKPGQHSKHSRHRLEDGKLGKNRSEVNIKTKDKQYKCKVCFQWFLTLGELDFHKLSHNPSPPPTCYMCVQRKFSSREQLRDHLKEKHAKNKAGLWACGMCLKEISDVWMYNEHLREHATQFARKGQAQKSVMGLPACFGEDNAAVTHFLNTIMYRRASKSSRHADSDNRHSGSRENRSPKELPLEQEALPMKDPLESNVKVKPSPPSSSKACASPSPEHMAKSESSPKSVPMHPDCKDPSRDCHHCGKQFPKPFKLQRHLVVHSLQKIYLCHKCPMFYQETKELRNHLSQEHGIVEEQEIKHTTLYACELCADVMHVIKKSFICSMCNYTFSKKEQYDRHMEKHLAGSNKTFKFRGVMRPGVASREGREKVKEEGSLVEPPSKKRKVVHQSSSLPRSSPVPHLDHAGDLHMAEAASPRLQAPSESFPLAAREPGAPLPQTPLKTEDLVGDFSDLLAEMETSQFDALPPPPCLSPSLPPATAGSSELGRVTPLSIEELEKGAFDGKPLPFLDSPEFNIDLAGLACNQVADEKRSPPRLTEKGGNANAHKKVNLGNKDEYVTGILENPNATTSPGSEAPFLQLAKKVPSPRAEVPQAKETNKTLWSNPSANDGPSWEGASKGTSSEAAHPTMKDKATSPVLNKAPKELTMQKKAGGSQASSDTSPNVVSPGRSAEESPKSSVPKEKAVPEAKESGANASSKEHGAHPGKSSGHHLKGEAASNAVRHVDKAALSVPGKLHPKKRKEHKSLSHRGSSGSRENVEGDGKKKKARAPGPGRSESTGELKHADWANAEASALSPGRRETHCNRLIPKPRTAGVGNQLKKMVLDTYNHKKAEMRPANGDVKRGKAILGKSFQQVLAKGPAARGALHGARGTRGAKAAEPASFRTAESQNHLLSQLFGQKLTSFKIPLRRDTSE